MYFLNCYVYWCDMCIFESQWCSTSVLTSVMQNSYLWYDQYHNVWKKSTQNNQQRLVGWNNVMWIKHGRWQWMNDWYFRPRSAILMLYWAGDNLGEWDEFWYEHNNISHLLRLTPVQYSLTVQNSYLKQHSFHFCVSLWGD